MATISSESIANGSGLHRNPRSPGVNTSDVIIPNAATDANIQPTSTSQRESYYWATRLGFQAKHEFVLWALCSSFMAFFVFIRLPYLDFPTFERQSSPGEWYWFRRDPYHFAIFLHLYTTLPAGLLAIIQFLPVIRIKAPFIHKCIGYAIMILLTLGNVAIAIISPISMGGNDLSLTAAIIVLIISTSSAMSLAWYNIRKQQIDEHRKWMLRAMFWMSIIVTMRLIMIVVIITVSSIGGYKTLWTCDQARFVTGDTIAFYEEFPACRLSGGSEMYIGVPADLKSPLHVGSAVRLTFAMTTWLAISLHTLAVEVYIHLTPKENERLRLMSYRRQLSLGLSPAGSAGLTAGSSHPWAPTAKKIT